jgi:VanZ family protein
LKQIKLPPRWLRDFAPVILWMAIIFVLSSQPRLIDIEGQAPSQLFYKTGHFVAYAGLAWLWWRALSPRRCVGWPVLLAAFGLTVLYGISDEVHQLFVPGRFGRVADVLFDAGGALAMVLLLRFSRRLRNFPENLVFRVEPC